MVMLKYKNTEGTESEKYQNMVMLKYENTEGTESEKYGDVA